MESLLELIVELVLECLFGLTIENPKVKTRVKTGIFLVFSVLVAGFILWISVKTYLNGNTTGGIVCGALSIALLIGFLAGAVYGHKRDWKQVADE